MSDVTVDLIDDEGRPWVTLPRCVAEVAELTRRYRTRAGKDDLCELQARYLVDGRPLCKRHAGDAVLKSLTNGRPLVPYREKAKA